MLVEPTRYRGTVTRVDRNGVFVGRYKCLGVEPGVKVGDKIKFEVVSDSQGEHAEVLGGIIPGSFASVNSELSSGSGWGCNGVEERLPSDYPMGGSGSFWKPV